MGKYLEQYIARIGSSKGYALADAVKTTTDKIIPAYVENFSYREHVTSLLVGDVQSGKTTHMFGIMSAAADVGFVNFVLLTTDNVRLQKQTKERAEQDLCDFCICDENDYLKYLENNARKPAVIVLKKNGRILKQWKNNFSSTGFIAGNPLFIVDDEADAASLNTEVNRGRQSSINRDLDAIRKTSSSSIYMEVTGTPQAILLQSRMSGWKPYFIHYFRPGNAYLGGNFFFPLEKPPHVIFTDDSEAAEILADDEFPENGLKSALIAFLLTAAQTVHEGAKVCNFLIHPSVRTDQHAIFAEKIGRYLNDICTSMYEDATEESFRTEYDGLCETKKDMFPFEPLYINAMQGLKEDKVSILVLNSTVDFEENSQYDSGVNIIVGGNTLGRGITFPRLQTIYYCRVSRNPQADTMWQHARMFGYDRDKDLMRVYMPPRLYRHFFNINVTNTSIIRQIETSANGTDIKISYPAGMRPTRANVLDNRTVGTFAGGANYFPYEPVNNTTENIDKLLENFEDGDYQVGLKFILQLLELVGSEANDWNKEAFMGFVKALTAVTPVIQGRLIVRRERDIAKGTGTLLSPNDRRLGDCYGNMVVLTMYKVTGNKGWGGCKLWVPNIKLPGNDIYYAG